MASELKPGMLLRGKWRLEKFLGRGGMSSVFAATHRNGMRGAIKVLHRELNSNAIIKSRFLREGYVANKVEHPNAVKVLDDDVTEDGLVFLVMELLEGETLKQRWVSSDRQLDVETTLEIIDHILDVLESAHLHGIVHRDLKPDNIFLVNNGSTKILDFGIARVLEAAIPGSADATSSAAMMGTPAFMPPEQALAHWDKVDSRSDLFAVGATAFTVLTGRLVHTGSTIPELLVAAATRQAQSIGAVMPDLDDAIVAAIDRALRFDIGERWPDARSMRLALLQARTRAFGNRTIKMPPGFEPATRQIPTVERAPASESTLLQQSPPEREDTEPPPPSPTAVQPGRKLDTPPLKTVEIPAQVEPARRPSKTQPVAPLVAGPPRPVARTLQSGVRGEAQVLAPAEVEPTPVRLQQAVRPEHVVRLASVSSLKEPGSRRPPSWLWWPVGIATAIAVGLVVTIANPGPRDRGPRDASMTSDPTTAPTASASAEVFVEPATASAQATSTQTTSTPSTTASSAKRAPSTSSATASMATTPRVLPPPPPKKKDGKRCKRFDTFDARKCVQFE